MQKHITQLINYIIIIDHKSFTVYQNSGVLLINDLTKLYKNRNYHFPNEFKLLNKCITKKTRHTLSLSKIQLNAVKLKTWAQGVQLVKFIYHLSIYLFRHI